MPALITHDFFGQDAYGELRGLVGPSPDERDAFLLGNQGPDPLFYSVANPRLLPFRDLGHTMHAEKPSELLDAFKRSLSVLADDERPIGRAYALGFLCHYLLDSEVHPLVYFHQYRLCDAGEPGLDRNDGSEVHAVIESELDEMLLFTRTGQTVATFAPEREILKASDQVLDIVSKMYAYAALVAYGVAVPQALFTSSVKAFRAVQRLFHSPSGMKRAIIARIEETVRPYSFYRSMSHRPIELEESAFENRAREPWEHPFTGETRTESFGDLFAAAAARARTALPAFAADGFDLEGARLVTGERNFSGEPVVATLVSVEDKGAGTAAAAEGPAQKAREAGEQPGGPAAAGAGDGAAAAGAGDGAAAAGAGDGAAAGSGASAPKPS